MATIVNGAGFLAIQTHADTRRKGAITIVFVQVALLLAKRDHIKRYKCHFVVNDRTRYAVATLLLAASHGYLSRHSPGRGTSSASPPCFAAIDRARS